LNAEVGGTDHYALAPASTLRRLADNMRATWATLTRPPRARLAWADRSVIAIASAVAVGVVLAAMVWLDPRSVAFARTLSPRIIEFFQHITHYGESGWFLWPLGLTLLALAALDAPAVPRFSRLVLATWSVRLGFVAAAIATPGLTVTIVKRLIGRARPLVEGSGVWSYQFLGWRVDHASLPSGHATTAFAALVAIGAIIPQARALLWLYAVLIALSRVVVGAHYPSDVIAGALAGSIGALLVRNWFAERRLGFSVTPDGRVHALPGPNIRRIAGALARSLRSLARVTA
jgi:membrane-associated phospholipid phosphatase